jgi:hypothetical protein
VFSVSVFGLLKAMADDNGAVRRSAEVASGSRYHRVLSCDRVFGCFPDIPSPLHTCPASFSLSNAFKCSADLPATQKNDNACGRSSGYSCSLAKKQYTVLFQ